MANRSRRAIRLFLASPSDVPEERAATKNVIDEINQTMGSSLGCVVELVGWENVAPSMGRPEQVILEQTEIDDCDLFVGVLWNRFGTPTGRADSGTEEEFLIAYESWQQHKRPHIMVYFCQRSANLQSEEELHQKLKVIQFRKSISEHGLFAEYTAPDNFEMLLRKHVTSHLFSRVKFPRQVQDYDREIQKALPARPPDKQEMNAFESLLGIGPPQLAIAKAWNSLAASLTTAAVLKGQPATDWRDALDYLRTEGDIPEEVCQPILGLHSLYEEAVGVPSCPLGADATTGYIGSTGRIADYLAYGLDRPSNKPDDAR